jgi:hypothetical protein
MTQLRILYACASQTQPNLIKHNLTLPDHFTSDVHLSIFHNKRIAGRKLMKSYVLDVP